MSSRTGRSKIAHDTLVFTAASLLAQSLSMVMAIYIRRELGPEAMGIWAILQVVLSYIAYSNLGIVNAVSRQIPVLRGGGASENQLLRMKNLGYSYLYLVAGITSLGLVCWTLLNRDRLTDAFLYGLITIAVVTMLERWVGYSVQILYADKRFGLVSRFRTYSAFLNCALTFFLVRQFHLYGFYAATLLSFLFDYLFLRVKSGLKFSFIWSRPELWALLKFGAPIALLAFANTTFFSMDKVSIGKLLGMAPLGVYTVALMAGRYVFMLPNIFQIVLLPNTLEKFGNESDKAGRRNVAVLPGRLMMVYFSLFLAAVWIAAPYLCARILPKYLDGIPSMKALIFGYAFMAMFTQTGHILLGLKRHTWTIPIVFTLAGVMWLLNNWIVRHGGGLFEMSLTMTFGLLIAYILTSYFALNTILTLQEFIKNLVINLLPMLYAVIILLGFDHFWPVDSVASIGIKSVLYLALWFMLAMALEKETGVLKILRDLVTTGFRNKRSKEAVAVT